MKKLTLFFYLLFGTKLLMQSQVVINEVSSASVSAYLDEDGDQEDWIEFYNLGSTAINMKGYSISRIENGKEKSWTFPSINIKSNDYLTIFCSSKNRRAYFDHWEVPVYANNPWKYFLGVTNPPSTWRSIAFNDASWFTGNGGIGYGDGDDSTIIPAVESVFMRKSFTIADTTKIPTAALLIDYDDAFVAYLNDVEIARANIGVYGDHPTFNTLAYEEHEATNYQNGQFSGAYFIQPEVLNSAKKPGLNVFSIQVHNNAPTSTDLSAIPYLLIGVNDTAVTYFPFPATVNLHTSFNLNSSGQQLTLKDSLGNIVDQYNIPAMSLNNTFGRRPNGANNWFFFDAPTPDTTNNFSPFYTNYFSKPSFTLPAGFYNGTQSLSLTTAAGVIVYTTDGKDPNQFSPIYSTPISISSNMVVRARAYSFNPMELPSEIITNTYFINENITLPVVSLVSDPYNIFDFNYGIYEFGPNADTVNIPFLGSNFWQGWERPANIEYFDENGTQGFETPTKIAIQGNYSKAWPQKGFAVKTSENYKGETIDYPLFPDKPNVTQYKSFNIRNAGSDWNTCHMRDRFNQKNAQKSTSLEIMDGRPCVLFINAKYYGVYELREKQDKDYIENNSGVSADKIDFLQFDGSIIEGSNKEFLEMAAYIGANNMTLPQKYDSIKSILDIENFVDYFITETYIVNVDWLGSYTNNIKFWRPNNPKGKWRYVLWDTDLSLAFGQSFASGGSAFNMLGVAINPTTVNPHSTMLKGLLDNVGFKNYFVNRYADLMNTIFQPTTMRANADILHDEMLPEMTRHFNKWGGTSPFPTFIGISNNVAEWESNLDTMFTFCDNRISNARNFIESEFSLVKQVDVTLNVEPSGAGKIKISTITPSTLPWTGVYFDGVPVTMTALPNEGFSFKYWKSDVVLAAQDSNIAITKNIYSNDRFTAYFEELENYLNVYPNPFGNNFTLVYKLPKSKQVSIKIYNTLGQIVAEPVSDNSFQAEGIHTMTIDANNLGNGVYFIEMRSTDFSQTIKLLRSKVQ